MTAFLAIMVLLQLAVIWVVVGSIYQQTRQAAATLAQIAHDLHELRYDLPSKSGQIDTITSEVRLLRKRLAPMDHERPF